jgi:hypothetical protein
LVEGDQERHIAADDLAQDSLGGAYLLFSAFIGSPSRQNISSDVLLLFGQLTIGLGGA